MQDRETVRGHFRARRVWPWLGMLLLLMVAPSYGKSYQRGGYHFDVAPAPAWVQVRKVADHWPVDAPGASGERWRFWLMDTQIDRRHGHRDVYVDRVYEPVSQEMVREAGKFAINFNPDFETLTLHRVELRRGGAWQQRLNPDTVTLARRESSFDSSDMATGEVSALIVLDDVRAGDVVRISYTISGSNPILGGMEAEKFFSDWFEPILERHARVWWDAGLPLDVRTSKGLAAPTVVSQGDSESVSLDLAKLPAVYNEGSYPRWYSPTGSLNVSVKRSWSDVAAWARKLYPAPQPLPADLQQRIRQWQGLPDVDQRIAAALRSVQEEVRYFGVELGESSHRPAEPAETWKHRYGDCKDKARLLATILRALGIEAYPAMVSAAESRGVHDWPASPNAFDHVIVQVRLPDTVLWLDATQTQQRGPVRSLSRDLLGTALLVSPDSHDLVDIQRQPSAVDHIRIDEHYVPDPQGRGVRLELRSEFRGSVAEGMRQQLQVKSVDELARSYSDYYRRRFGELDGAAPAIHDNADTGALVITAQYHLADPWVEHAGRAIDLNADAIGGLMNLPQVARRSAPYAIGVPVEVEQTIRFDVPGGWSPINLPVSQQWGDKAMKFEHRLEIDGSHVVLANHYSGLAEDVSAADFPAHFELMRKTREQIFTRLSFRAPAGAGDTQDRDQRLDKLLRGVMEQSDAHGS